MPSVIVQMILPSSLALFLGMAPVLVPLRPSNEHILIVRVPGARDQHECHSSPFTAQFTFLLADFFSILLESAHTYA